MSLRDNKLLCRRGFNCRNWENLTLKCNGGKRVYLQMLSFFHTTTLTLFAHIIFLLRCSKTAFGAFTMVTLQTEHCSGSDWFLENTTKFDPIAANFPAKLDKWECHHDWFDRFSYVFESSPNLWPVDVTIQDEHVWPVSYHTVQQSQI